MLPVKQVRSVLNKHTKKQLVLDDHFTSQNFTAIIS